MRKNPATPLFVAGSDSYSKRAQYSAKAFAVKLAGVLAVKISAKEPAKTIWPPFLPPRGPRSTI